MDDSGRRKSIIAASSLFFVVLFVMGGIVLYKKMYQPSPSPSPVSSPTTSAEATAAAGDEVTVETISRTPIADPADASLLTIVITYRVKSIDATDKVVIEEELEDGHEYIEDSATPHVAVYEPSTRRIRWQLKGVPVGYEGSLTYQVKK